MKKLIIATAIVAASTASVAMANDSKFGFDKPFVAVTVGTNTNDVNGIDATVKEYKELNIGSVSSVKHTVDTGIQAGANLVTITPKVALGAEIDASYGFRGQEVKVNVTADNSINKLHYTRYAIDPMAYIAFSPINKLSLKAKAGYGYQHLESTQTGTSDYNAHKWEPVLAAEAGYSVISNVSIIAGDRYTFGPKADATTFKKPVPRENVVYVGVKYTF
jgi:hypothetical protein